MQVVDEDEETIRRKINKTVERGTRRMISGTRKKNKENIKTRIKEGLK